MFKQQGVTDEHELRGRLVAQRHHDRLDIAAPIRNCAQAIGLDECCIRRGDGFNLAPHKRRQFAHDAPFFSLDVAFGNPQPIAHGGHFRRLDVQRRAGRARADHDAFDTPMRVRSDRKAHATVTLNRPPVAKHIREVERQLTQLVAEAFACGGDGVACTAELRRSLVLDVAVRLDRPQNRALDLLELAIVTRLSRALPREQRQPFGRPTQERTQRTGATE